MLYTYYIKYSILNSRLSIIFVLYNNITFIKNNKKRNHHQTTSNKQQQQQRTQRRREVSKEKSKKHASYNIKYLLVPTEAV